MISFKFVGPFNVSVLVGVEAEPASQASSSAAHSFLAFVKVFYAGFEYVGFAFVVTCAAHGA